MLVLTRKYGEAVIVAPGTTRETKIVFLGMRGKEGRIGFLANDGATILREELILNCERKGA